MFDSEMGPPTGEIPPPTLEIARLLPCVVRLFGNEGSIFGRAFCAGKGRIFTELIFCNKRLVLIHVLSRTLLIPSKLLRHGSYV